MEMWYNTGVIPNKIVGRSGADNALRPDTRKVKFLMLPHSTLNLPQSEENWMPVLGFETQYEVSDFGRVRRIGTGRGSRNQRQRNLVHHPQGYFSVALYSHNQGRSFLVHRLVVEAFLGPITNGYDVNHRDGNKRNNHLSNLEIMTRAENIRHAVDTGLMPVRGEGNPMSRLTTEQVLEIRRLHGTGYAGYKAIAAMFNVSWGAIRNIIKRHTWKHL